MRVFVAGGTGVIGRQLVPQLVARGHHVTATGPGKLGMLEQVGADAVVMDGLDGLARLLAGEVAATMMTEGRGFSNAKAKRELGWTLRHPSWRQGFKAVMA